MNHIVQLIHVSDLHIAPAKAPQGATTLLGLAKKLDIPVLRELLQTGMAGASADAAAHFAAAIPKMLDGWEGETCLVDTGDLATFGDAASLRAGQAYLDEYAAHCDRKFQLHGNHDAWPEDFPAAVTSGAVHKHRQWLRSEVYPQRWPERPFVWRTDDAEVQLYGLNTVLHGRARNTLALGYVEHDRFWERFRTAVAQHQLNELEELTRQYRPEHPEKRTLRVLACHHPLHFPPEKAATGALFKDAAKNLENLAWSKIKREPPLNSKEIAGRLKRLGFGLVLSGHTHRLFPSHGALNLVDPSSTRHLPLVGIPQLVVGTLTQVPRAAADGTTAPAGVEAILSAGHPPDRANQAQVVRLAWSARKNCLVLTRDLWVRQSRTFEPEASERIYFS